MTECAQCRDWGGYELHEDHWPSRSPEDEERLASRLAEVYGE